MLTLVAQNAHKSDKGTAITIVNCIGFSITILSIQLVSAQYHSTNSIFVYLLLAIGPIFGLLAIETKKRL